MILLAACSHERAPEDASCVTTVSGTVYAPNGTLPIWNAQVYASAAPAAIVDGPVCGCVKVDGVATDVHGAFTLPVLAGDVPFVVETGKWRRQITVHADACVETKVDVSLPSYRSQGAIPRIAISTGNSDALECLIAKLGISATEITNVAGGGRVNLFSDRQAPGQGANKFVDGRFFDDSAQLWDTMLGQYDLVLLSCEGAPYPQTKTNSNLNAMRDYANAGGRVYVSHWHDYWIEQRWPEVATFDDTAPVLPDGSIDTIARTEMAQWLGADQILLGAGTGRQQAVSTTGEVWVTHDQQPQMFAFTTPVDQPCGRVVYTDMHVSGDSTSSPDVPYPGGCATTDLTPQEKALAFALFDLGSCVSLR